MILEVQHETRFEYSEPVREVLTEVRMEPASDADQSCHSYHLAVTPTTGVFRHQDGFGNRVHHFNLLAPPREVRILSASIVETHPRPRDLAASRAAFPLQGELPLEVLDFVRLGGPVRPTPRLAPLLDALRPAPGERVADLALGVAGHLHAHFEYARDVTLATSPVDDFLRQGKGVCQDFTHLMLALLRSFGVPARYVSGYLHRVGEESQSHAWCEAWVPDLGWLGIDPTNDCLADGRFVRVALGRDFSDVPPNRGVYRGRASESIFVRVATRELERLPSLSWQEQLPPLTAPLTAIVPRPRPAAGQDEELQQQQ